MALMKCSYIEPYDAKRMWSIFKCAQIDEAIKLNGKHENGIQHGDVRRRKWWKNKRKKKRRYGIKWNLLRKSERTNNIEFLFLFGDIVTIYCNFSFAHFNRMGLHIYRCVKCAICDQRLLQFFSAVRVKDATHFTATNDYALRSKHLISFWVKRTLPMMIDTRDEQSQSSLTRTLSSTLVKL